MFIFGWITAGHQRKGIGVNMCSVFPVNGIYQHEFSLQQVNGSDGMYKYEEIILERVSVGLPRH